MSLVTHVRSAVRSTTQKNSFQSSLKSISCLSVGHMREKGEGRPGVLPEEAGKAAGLRQKGT